MRKIICASALISSALLLTGTAYADMYKWTDKNGKTHYTQTPPPADVDSENIEADIRLSAGKASGKATPAQVADNGEQQDTLAKAREAGAKSEQKHKEFCAQQKAAMKQMTANSLIKWKDSDGERFLTADEKAEKMQELEKNLNSMCRPEMFNRQDRELSEQELASGKRFQQTGSSIKSGGKSADSQQGAAGSSGSSGDAATGGLLPAAD